MIKIPPQKTPNNVAKSPKVLTIPAISDFENPISKKNGTAKEPAKASPNLKNITKAKIMYHFSFFAKSENGKIIHKGISQRQFARSFTIAEDVKVNGAELKDGLLTIACERVVPEYKKKKLIEIK